MRKTYVLLELLASEYKCSDILFLQDQRKDMLKKGLISEEEKAWLDEIEIDWCYYGTNEDDWNEAETKEEFTTLLENLIWGVKNLDRVRYVATDKDGSIFAYEYKPRKVEHWDDELDDWVSGVTWESEKFCIEVTEQQAIKLCGSVPKWTDDNATEVKLPND